MTIYGAYVDLLSKSYEDAVYFLLEKYGPAQNDYFRENSYRRFMNGEINSIAKGKITRTAEGLYCHHMDENKWLKISDKDFVKKFSIPFETQKKDRLVYCDVVEHTILHVLISKETGLRYGYPGYEAFLKPHLEEWYLNKRIPQLQWMKNCYSKAFLEPQQAFDLLNQMQNVLGVSYYESLVDYYEAKMQISLIDE